ncbi:magnesium and cobalt transport protein CorA [Lysinibacter cavernae]|uniref:Magnesium transporter n=1 Tax=Lysinibacter cavernae TaxID=1640652 RepID=A0A7X5R439_9MICO|nr:magnesium and cobalt transport protein CorA [Lysinibacter cavernae]NIH55211.1 magnesium transporter [Lysinibacter cavernae]
MTLMINSIYIDGELQPQSPTLEDTYARLHSDGGIAYIALHEPPEAELKSVAHEFGLHELAVEDALRGHQRAKLERYGDTLFAVLRPAAYLDAEETVEFGEIHVFVGPNFFISIVQVEPRDDTIISRSLERIKRKPELFAMGPQALLYALFDSVVDAYSPVVDGLEQDIDQIEEQLFAGNSEVSRRIYELFSEVVEFQRSTRPLVYMLEALLKGADKYGVPVELQRRFRDVRDHVIRIVERSDSFRTLLQNALTVNSTLVAQQQNDDMKRISAWAAIFFAPTLIGSIYGMNFDIMPELHWEWGYAGAVGGMVLLAVFLYFAFRRRKWL